MLYAITDRMLTGDAGATRAQLVQNAAVWAKNGVAWIQLREKDLGTREQVALARAMQAAIRSAADTCPCLLINNRPDVALAAGAGGVHLPADPQALTPAEVRRIFHEAGAPRPRISLSCHTLTQVRHARQADADCILFAPVFGKTIRTAAGREQVLPGAGLEALAAACQAAAPIPVYALGGVTERNAAQCLAAGAAGIAAIRLFQRPPEVWSHFAK